MKNLARDIFESLLPEKRNLLPFPPEGDRGEKSGDEQLAEIIYYGTTTELNEDHILFAIQLGRQLEKAKVLND